MPRSCAARPGHADYTAQVKYRAASRSCRQHTGELTAPLCIAGGIAMQILARRGVQIGAHLASVADVCDEALDPVAPDMAQLAKAAYDVLPTLSHEAGEKMRAAIMAAKAAGDSVGGIIECAAAGVPAGLGDPMFDGMENRIARRLLSPSPRSRGVNSARASGAAELRGCENNDPVHRATAVRVVTADQPRGRYSRRHHHGHARACSAAAVKPTPSIALPQRSGGSGRRCRKLQFGDSRVRHDPLHRAPRGALHGGGRGACRNRRTCWSAWLEWDKEVI